MRLFSLLLIITGILMFVFNGMEYQKENTATNAGTFEIRRQEKEYIVWPSMAGTVCLIGGIVLFIRGQKKDVVA
jgi:hypothetical protein